MVVGTPATGVVAPLLTGANHTPGVAVRSPVLDVGAVTGSSVENVRGWPGSDTTDDTVDLALPPGCLLDITACGTSDGTTYPR